MSVLSTAGGRISMAGRLIGARVHLTSLVPPFLLLVLFKLSLSDGGRHPETLTLAQTAVDVLVIALAAAGVLHLTRLGGSLALVIAAAGVSTAWSVQLDASMRTILMWVMYLGIQAGTASTLRTAAAVRWLVDGLVVIAGWLCLIGLFVFWGANNPSLRWSSTFYWADAFAAFLLLVLPVELSRLLHATAGRETLVHGALSVLLAGSLLLTYSRGAWMSLLAVIPLAVLTVRAAPWTRSIWRLAVIGLVTAATAAVLARGPQALRDVEDFAGRVASIADTGNYSLQGRLHFWRAGLAIFTDHPVVGTGPGTFGTVHAAYQRDVRYYARDVHSLYVQALSEEGIVGFAALAALLGALVTTWMSALRATHRSSTSPLVVGMGLGLAAFFLHSGFDMDWMFPANPAMAMMMAGALAWLAKDGAAVQGPSHPAVPSWQRYAVIGVLLPAVALTQIAHVADRQFAAGQALARGGRWAEAAGRYARAAWWDPVNAKFLAAHAAALQQLTPPRRDIAEASLRRAMAVDRMNAAHPIRLAAFLMDDPAPGSATHQEIERLLVQALAADPWNRPDAYRLLAEEYIRQGRTAEADRVYREALGRYAGYQLVQASPIYFFLWPEVVSLYLDAANASKRRGELPRAAEILEALLREDPQAVVVAIRLSEIYAAMGRPTQARLVLVQMAQRVPGNADVRAALERLP